MSKVSSPAVKKGEIGEARFALFCLERDIICAKPKADLHRIDFVVEWEGEFRRVNVKTLHYVPTADCYQAELNTSNGKGSRPYRNDEIDFFAVVSLEYDRIWMIPWSATKNRLNVRWHPPEKCFKRRQDSFNWDPYLIKCGQEKVFNTYSLKIS